MAKLRLYSHPFSSYCQKVLIALYENATPFAYESLDGDAARGRELRAYWPIGKFPVLIDGDRVVAETSVIIEYLQIHHPGPVRFLPDDPAAALEARFMDRFFDMHVMTPVQSVVGEALRPESDRQQEWQAIAEERLETAYGWLEPRLADRAWAAGDDFGLADCAAAPSLFYANWVHEIGPAYPALRAYRSRLRERPSVARTVEEARPFRGLFPLGAPEGRE